MNNYQLYRFRTLTENMNMVFDFVGDNWRLWLKLMIYFLLPFSVLLGYTTSTMASDFYSFVLDTQTVASAVLFTVGSAVVTALMLLLVKWSETHDYSLDGCSVAAIWRMLPMASLKCLGIIVIVNLLMGLCSLLAIILIGVAGILALLPLFLLCPIMLLEPHNSFGGLFRRAFSLGYKKWGALMLIVMVMCMVSIPLFFAVAFPIITFTEVASLLEESAANSVFYSFGIDLVYYLLCVAECFMIYVEIGLFTLAMTYHYGSVASEVDDLGLENDIENFDQLK